MSKKFLIDFYKHFTFQDSRDFIREKLGKMNQMEGVEYKFQILFVFGQSYMSKEDAQNLTLAWKKENSQYHDLIITGKPTLHA